MQSTLKKTISFRSCRENHRFSRQDWFIRPINNRFIRPSKNKRLRFAELSTANENASFRKQHSVPEKSFVKGHREN